MNWCDLTTADIAHADMASHVAVLPFAAVEQHGPHLPLGTDAFIMDGYLDRVRALLPVEAKVLVLPVQSIGCSAEHEAFAGTLSVGPRDAIAAWTNIADGVVAAGCRRLILVNSHGGNSAVLDLATQELRVRHRVLAVHTSWQRLGYPDGLFAEAEVRYGIHGGEIETSLMLAFRPDLVRMEAARDFVSLGVEIERRFARLRIGRPAGFGWMAQDLSRDGVAGNAAAATADKGERCAAHGAQAFMELLDDVASFDLSALRDGSSTA